MHYLHQAFCSKMSTPSASLPLSGPRETSATKLYRSLRQEEVTTVALGTVEAQKFERKPCIAATNLNGSYVVAIVSRSMAVMANIKPWNPSQPAESSQHTDQMMAAVQTESQRLISKEEWITAVAVVVLPILVGSVHRIEQYNSILNKLQAWEVQTQFISYQFGHLINPTIETALVQSRPGHPSGALSVCVGDEGAVTLDI